MSLNLMEPVPPLRDEDELHLIFELQAPIARDAVFTFH